MYISTILIRKHVTTIGVILENTTDLRLNLLNTFSLNS